MSTHRSRESIDNLEGKAGAQRQNDVKSVQGELHDAEGIIEESWKKKEKCWNVELSSPVLSFILGTGDGVCVTIVQRARSVLVLDLDHPFHIPKIPNTYDGSVPVFGQH